MKEEGESPKFVEHKHYCLCTEDNPNKQGYTCIGTERTISPDCKLTLELTGIATEEMRDIEKEIRTVLEFHKFSMR